MDNLLSGDNSFQVKVSSVLNKNVKEYGKQFLTDGREDTCWNSDQGLPQFVQIAFDVEQTLVEIGIMFQGGFAGKDCTLESSKDGVTFHKVQDFYPEDNNKLQKFSVENETCKAVKLVFHKSTDFYGRITIYQLKLC